MSFLFHHVRRHYNDRMTSYFGKRFFSSAPAAAADSAGGGGFRLRDVPNKHPLAFGSVFTSLKTMTADIVVQKFIEQKEELNMKRVAVFGSFGLVYLGAIQYGIYVKGFTRLFPGAGEFAKKSVGQKLKDRGGMAALGGQLFLDQCVHVPFLFFPVYYMTKEAILGDPKARQRTGKSVPETALTKYKKNFIEDNSASIAIWLPVNIVNFGFMPMAARIPFMACISLGYCMFLSMKRGAPTKSASKLYEDLPNLDDKLIEKRFQEVLPQFSSNKDQLLTREQFCEVFRQFGVSDEQVLQNLFAIGGTDGNADVPASDVAALLFTLSGTGDAVERMASMFSACDLDGSDQIEHRELKSVMLSMIRIRERLFRVMTREEAGDVLVLKTPKVAGGDDDNESGEAHQRGRLELLKERSAMYADLETIEQVLDKEADALAEQVFLEADVGSTNSPSGEPSPDGYITYQEFSQWLKKKSSASQNFVQLFQQFKQ